MSAPVLNTSGDQTPHRLSTVDINLTAPLNTGAPNWQTLQYMEDSDFNPDNAVFVESQIYGDAGWGNQDAMGASWNLTATLNHMVVPGSNPPTYDPTHDFLETFVGKFGRARRVQLRMYDWDVNDTTGLITPRGQAYTGFASLSWPGFGTGGPTDKRLVAVPFMGKGPLVKIPHPFPLAPAVPVVNAVNPDTLLTAGGGSFEILGSGFDTVTGATGVKFGGTNATSYTVLSPTHIIGVYPAHAAGTGVAVLVTNTTGPSVGGDTVVYA
jgi:hypothetical protein